MDEGGEVALADDAKQESDQHSSSQHLGGSSKLSNRNSSMSAAGKKEEQSLQQDKRVMESLATKLPSIRRKPESMTFEGKIIKPQPIGQTGEGEERDRRKAVGFAERRTHSFDTPNIKMSNPNNEKEGKRDKKVKRLQSQPVDEPTEMLNPSGTKTIGFASANKDTD